MVPDLPDAQVNPDVPDVPENAQVNPAVPDAAENANPGLPAAERADPRSSVPENVNPAESTAPEASTLTRWRNRGKREGARAADLNLGTPPSFNSQTENRAVPNRPKRNTKKPRRYR